MPQEQPATESGERSPDGLRHYFYVPPSLRPIPCPITGLTSSSSQFPLLLLGPKKVIVVGVPCGFNLPEDRPFRSTRLVGHQSYILRLQPRPSTIVQFPSTNLALTYSNTRIILLSTNLSRHQNCFLKLRSVRMPECLS